MSDDLSTEPIQGRLYHSFNPSAQKPAGWCIIAEKDEKRIQLTDNKAYLNRAAATKVAMDWAGCFDITVQDRMT